MPLTLLSKDFFQPVNSQKPRTERGICIPFRHVPHSDKTGNPFVASKGMHRLSMVKKTFVINSKTDKSVLCNKLYLLKGLIAIEPKISAILPKFPFFGPIF